MLEKLLNFKMPEIKFNFEQPKKCNTKLIEPYDSGIKIPTTMKLWTTDEDNYTFKITDEAWKMYL